MSEPLIETVLNVTATSLEKEGTRILKAQIKDLHSLSYN